jgi:hypothetical protein
VSIADLEYDATFVLLEEFDRLQPSPFQFFAFERRYQLIAQVVDDNLGGGGRVGLLGLGRLEENKGRAIFSECSSSFS